MDVLSVQTQGGGAGGDGGDGGRGGGAGGSGGGGGDGWMILQMHCADEEHEPVLLSGTRKRP